MRKLLSVLMFLAGSAYAQELIKVTGERVSLRAAPETNAVLLGKASRGDQLVLHDNSRPDWVGVLPPNSINLWVSSEFVSNNVALPEILNIRSGPSLSHSIVGSASRGEKLTVRGEIGEWTGIVPTSNTTIWISRRFVDAPAMVPAVTGPGKPVVFEEFNAAGEPMDVAAAEAGPEQKKLVLNPAKKQGVAAAYTGVLQRENDQLYKLVDDHFKDVDVCYVRGNAAQMQTFCGMKLQITGKAYWVSGKDLPVVVPSRLRLYATGE
jgi:hypothetical protein